jgi:hypothetical protein
MKRLVVALTVGFFLVSGSSAHAAEKVMYQEITDNKPEVGVSTTVYLGDRMLEQRKGSYKDCVIPKFASDKSMFGAHFIIKQGEPLCRSSKDADRYIAPYPNAYQGVTQANHPVKIKIKGEQAQLCLAGMCSDWQDKALLQVEPWFLYSSNAFQQVIEYAGRNGDNLKFTYSEFTDGFARQAFTREFQVDLTQGKVAAYKGAIIEIESATNSSITYKVVRHFQQ